LNNLNNTHILLIVCGGIAAYKSAELVRLLHKQHADVRVVMTEAAQAFVGPLTFQALSGHPVHSQLLNNEEENAMGHINLARWADFLVIAPASANTLAKCAHGIADNLATTLFLAATCPIYVAPAMNQAMWSNPFTQDNIRKLLNNGVNLIEPLNGEQACGETGPGRMAEPADICHVLLSCKSTDLLKGIKVTVSAGPTREYIDPVRFISNRSSGKMGYALAQAAKKFGAKVNLISGPVNLPPPNGIDIVNVETAEQMHQAVMATVVDTDIYIGAAAVADYIPELTEQSKIKKHHVKTNLTLTKTKDILADVAALKTPPFTVGFAAETDDLENYAKTKLREKKLDMIAANWVGKKQGGFDSDQNALEIFWHNGHQSLPLTNKIQLAEELLKLIASHYHEKNRI
jgi:phosphopantothenoylcysteine decarboxylase/phosphopantothenate--cysteine ligase